MSNWEFSFEDWIPDPENIYPLFETDESDNLSAPGLRISSGDRFPSEERAIPKGRECLKPLPNKSVAINGRVRKRCNPFYKPATHIQTLFMKYQSTSPPESSFDEQSNIRDTEASAESDTR